MLTQKIFKAARIKDGPAPKDAAPRKAGQLLRDMGQDINGIGHDKENALIIAFGNLRNDRAKNGGILFYQIKARFAHLLAGARRNDNDGGIHDIIIVSSVDVHRGRKDHAVTDIHGFPFRPFPVHIDKDQFRKKSLFHQGKGTCSPDHTAANNGNLSSIDFRIHSKAPFTICISFTYSSPLL